MTDKAIRNDDLKEMLRERRSAVQGEVQDGIRRRRTDRPKEVRDDLEHSDADIQGDIEFTVLQMRAETLTRIEQALVRLDAGKYGSCFECESEISEQRLRALPFAVRCQACEESREAQQGHVRKLAQQRGGHSLFPTLVRS